MEGGGDIYATHAFIRDRTRSIRQDFTVQNYRGREAIECHERIARYHILCLHCLCDNPNFSEQQEMEQLRKVLQSLVEFYKDNKKSSAPFPLPNEAEFRSYYALVFLRDQDVSRQLETLPEDIFFSEPMMRSLSFRSLAQRSNDRFVQNNSEAAQNLFTRFFRSLKSSATYLEACILETWFGSIRTGALKALRQAFGGMKAVQISQVSVEVLVSMLGFDDTEQLVAFCNYLGLELVLDENGRPIAVWFKRNVTWEGESSYIANELVLTCFQSPLHICISSLIISSRLSAALRLTNRSSMGIIYWDLKRNRKTCERIFGFLEIRRRSRQFYRTTWRPLLLLTKIRLG